MALSYAKRTVLLQPRQPPAAPPTVPTPVAELWADCSNYTGFLTDRGCADLKAAGYVGVIVQAITGLDGNTYTRQQLGVAARNGLRTAGYVWCFPGASVTSIRNRLAMFDPFTLEFLALDVEQAGLTVTDVDRDLAECDAYMAVRGVVLTGWNKDGVRLLHPTVFYSGRWYFAQQNWLGLARWSDRPLWDSNFDGIPDASVNFRPYGGWTKCAIKQFRGSSSIGEVDQIDLNITAGS